MELIVFSIIVLPIVTVCAFPGVFAIKSRSFDDQKIKKSGRVSAAYWGMYEGQDGVGLVESIELPQPCKKMRTPVGGTAYGKGKAFVS